MRTDFAKVIFFFKLTIDNLYTSYHPIYASLSVSSQMIIHSYTYNFLCNFCILKNKQQTIIRAFIFYIYLQQISVKVRYIANKPFLPQIIYCWLVPLPYLLQKVTHLTPVMQLPIAQTMFRSFAFAANYVTETLREKSAAEKIRYITSLRNSCYKSWTD